MSERFSFSGQHLEIEEIADHYSIVKDALRGYFSQDLTYNQRFIGYTKKELQKELEQRIEEEDKHASLSILSALEAAFRIDYWQRVDKSKKDCLSKAFKILFKEKGMRVSLEEEIFAEWIKYSNAPRYLIGDLKGAFKYRHWLAHGRYWEPKLGKKKYDFFGIYTLAKSIINSFNLLAN